MLRVSALSATSHSHLPSTLTTLAMGSNKRRKSTKKIRKTVLNDNGPSGDDSDSVSYIDGVDPTWLRLDTMLLVGDSELHADCSAVLNHLNIKFLNLVDFSGLSTTGTLPRMKTQT